MKILAFDQSTIRTGWALFEDGHLKESGVYDIHKIKDERERSYLMYQFIYEIALNKQPDKVVAEAVSLQNPNVRTIVELARVQGLIRAASYHLPFLTDVVFYEPAQWRKTVGIQTGRGIKRAELKKASMQMVAERYNKQVSDDEADAILMGQAACSLITENKEN